MKKLPTDRPLLELDIIKCFLRNGEYLSSMRVSDMDSDFISASVTQLKVVDNTVLTVFDPDSREYVKVDFTQHLQKAIGLIFAKDLNVKVYGSEGAYSNIKTNTSRFIARAKIPLSIRPEYQEKFGGMEFKIKQAVNMVKIGTTDPQRANLMCIKGMGIGTYDILIENKIDTVEKFVATDTDKLDSILRWKKDTIEKMKEDAVANMPLAEL